MKSRNNNCVSKQGDLVDQDLKKLSMSELIALYNTLPGVSPVTEFKNLAAGRAAIQNYSGVKMTEEATQVETTVPATGEQVATPEGDTNKYSTVGKRGPNQGIGEFAKQLLTAGVSTADVLAQVKANFPTAKTSASCIAYYKAALKNPMLGKRKGVADPAALRAKAAELMAAAEAADKAVVEAAEKQAALAKAAAEASERAAAIVAAQQAAKAEAEAQAATEAASQVAAEGQPQA
jgi:hypothetical protein